MILALDISLKTGFAAGNERGFVEFGTRDFSGLSKDRAIIGRRYRRWINSLLDSYEPHDLFIEAPVLFSGERGGATRLLLGLNWEAHRAAQIRDIPRHEVHLSTIKKSITGNGRADKFEVIQAVKNRGYRVKNDNEADAVALMLHGLGDHK